jgi:hypothetical protein
MALPGPRELIPLVRKLLEEQPATIDELHERLLERRIRVPIHGLQHMLEAYPVHFRRVRLQWHAMVLRLAPAKPQARDVVPSRPFTASVTPILPMTAWSSSTGPSCSFCRMAHVDGSSCTFGQMWR